MDFHSAGHRRLDGEKCRGASRIDPEDRLLGGADRRPVVRSAGGSRSDDAPDPAAAAAPEGAPRPRSRAGRRPYQGYLPADERCGGRHRLGYPGGAARGARGVQAERQIHRRLQRDLFAGRLLPGFGSRQNLHAARGYDGVVGIGHEPDVLQGAAGQTRSQGRSVPSHGLQIQKCRRTLYL